MPPDNATGYATLYNQIVMLSVFVGPMVGSQLATTPLGLPAVLLIGAGGRLLAGAVIGLPWRVRPALRPRKSGALPR